MAALELEKILQKLLIPDSNIIQQATLELKRAFLHPEKVTPALVELLQTSTEPTIRQYCAILLRRRVVKQWKNVDVTLKNNLKDILLLSITKETLSFVRSSLCQVVGSIARYELVEKSWPQLFQFLLQCVQSSLVDEREVGFSLLRAVCEAAPEQLKSWYTELFPVFRIGLGDSASSLNPYLSIKCMTPLIQFFGSEEELLLKPMLGDVMDVIKQLLTRDEDKANEALDFFDELVQVEVGIIVPYVKPLLQFCMQVTECKEFDDGLRIKALYLLCWACRRKCRTIMKANQLKPLLMLLLSLMSIPEDEDEKANDLESAEGAEMNSLQSVAGQALDLLALHSPSSKIIPILMGFLSPMFSSTETYERKAAYIALGELAEGCADFIRTRHLQSAVETTMKGLSDVSYVVRNAALFALGQLAEHVQPDVSQLHANVIPVLLTLLEAVIIDPQANLNHKGTITKLFYALEKFTEGLEKDVVLVYADSLMNAFLSLLKSAKESHTTELAISAIGALATSAQNHLSGYFSIIMEHFKVFLQLPLTLENMDLLAQTVDTLGALARSINPETFLPVAEECIQFGVKMVEDCDDPDLKRCTYGLFAAVSFVLKEKMVLYLPSITQLMIQSLKSTEGIVATSADSNDPCFLIEDDVCEEDLENGDDDNDDDDDHVGYTVENAYMDEKEDTINSLVELSEQIGNPMMPHLQEIFDEVFLLIDYPHPDVRKAAVTGCCRLTIVVYNLLKQNHIADGTPAQTCLQRSLPTAINIMNKDDDRAVVTSCVEVLNKLLRSLSSDAFCEKRYAEDLARAVVNLFKGKAHCQQFSDDDISHASTDDDDVTAELDMLLVEQTGDLLPPFAQAIGGESFKEVFALVLPELKKKTGKSSTVAERSFVAGTTAEIIQAMGLAIREFVTLLAPWLLQLLQDDDDEVRSNAAFALGVLCEQGKDAAFGMYVNILQALFGILNAHQQPAMVQDNVCGAVARMIMTSIESLPIDQVLLVLVGCLPIKEDESENETVTTCFVYLYERNSEMLLPYMEKILPWFLCSLHNEKSGLSSDTRQKVRQTLVNVETKYPHIVANIAPV